MSSKKTEDKHEHVWGAGYHMTEQRCSCGAIKVSPEEYEFRMKAWQDYYLECSKSEAAINFSNARIAFLNHDKEGLKATIAIGKRLQQENVWIPKPKFPNPQWPSVQYVT